MTVSTTPSIIRYVYSAPEEFTFDFKVFNTSEVKVRSIDAQGVVSSPWTLGLDYTVTLTTGANGGICYVSKVVDAEYIDIYRDIPITQETVWENYGPFNADQLETDLDRCIMILQELKNSIDDTVIEVGWRGDWVTSVAYSLRDMITGPDGNLYYCVVAHTSGTFVTDLAAAKWQLMLESEAGSSPSIGDTLTIASGVLTIPNNRDGRYRVAGEGAAADTLAQLSGSIDEGVIVTLYADDDAIAITIPHSSYIILNGEVDFEMTNSYHSIMLLSKGSNVFQELSRSAGGAA